MISKKKLFALITLIGFFIPLDAQNIYPEIKRLSKDSDPYFFQLQNEIENYYRTSADEKLNSELLIYLYKMDTKLNIYQISAILNLPYDTIATINNLSAPSDISNSEYILIPSQPGIAVSINPETDYQKLMNKTDRNDKPVKKIIISVNNQRKEYLFYPGESLSKEERSAFLQKQFRFPSDSRSISSHFGYRIHPFSGDWSFHNGVDIKMDENSEVFSSYKGIVKETGFSQIYGYYIIIIHQNGFESMYGHLNTLKVIKDQVIQTGEQIALSGNSGLSSGPHLHFEIRKNGKAVDPLLYLQKGKQYADK